jgi:uncharacterized membrane protein YeaQ/YmgE (transglycosylase-associated protein family)
MADCDGFQPCWSEPSPNPRLKLFPLAEFRSDAMNVLWFLLVGVIAGWLAGVLVKGGGFGLIGDLVVGIIGALIGGLLFGGLAGAAGGGLLGSILVATLGAVILLVVLRVLKRA